jgi:hypothetical protein
MVDVNQMIGIAVIVLVGFISITLLSNFSTVASCSTIANSTLKGACNGFFNNAATLFSLIAVLILLLVIPMIRGIIGARQ